MPPARPGYPSFDRGGRAARLALGAGLVLAFLGVYALTNLTPAGQLAENSLLRLDWGRSSTFLVDVSRTLSFFFKDTVRLPTFDFAEPTGVIGTVVAVGIAAAQRHWRAALTVAIAAPAAVALTELFKDVVGRPHLVHSLDVDPSYPSGHATLAFAVTVALLSVVPRRWLPVAVPVLLGWCVVIGAGVVNLGDHRLSDIVGSALLVSAAFVLVGAVTAPTVERIPVRELWSRRTRIVLLVALVVWTIANSWDLAWWPTPLITVVTLAAVAILGGAALTVCRVSALPAESPPSLASERQPEDVEV